jgi:tRNA-binding protein
MATLEDFLAIDVRVGRVVSAEPFPEGKYSTHILMIDFGPEIGVKKSLAKLAPNYAYAPLVGTQVLAVVNFPPRQIGKHLSECLTLGLPDAAGNVVLVRPETEVPEGGKLH